MARNVSVSKSGKFRQKLRRRSLFEDGKFLSEEEKEIGQTIEIERANGPFDHCGQVMKPDWPEMVLRADDE